MRSTPEKLVVKRSSGPAPYMVTGFWGDDAFHAEIYNDWKLEIRFADRDGDLWKHGSSMPERPDADKDAILSLIRTKALHVGMLYDAGLPCATAYPKLDQSRELFIGPSQQQIQQVFELVHRCREAEVVSGLYTQPTAEIRARGNLLHHLTVNLGLPASVVTQLVTIGHESLETMLSHASELDKCYRQWRADATSGTLIEQAFRTYTNQFSATSPNGGPEELAHFLGKRLGHQDQICELFEKAGAGRRVPIGTRLLIDMIQDELTPMLSKEVEEAKACDALSITAAELEMLSIIRDNRISINDLRNIKSNSYTQLEP